MTLNSGKGVGESRKRKERFREIISYAMERLGKGAYLASQRQLADVIGVSPSMIKRYLDGETEIHDLRLITLLRLAEAARVHPGALAVWVEEGRDAVLDHQSRLDQGLESYTARDHAERLLKLLTERELGAEIVAPAVSLIPLVERVKRLEAQAGVLMTRMVALAGAQEAMEHLEEGVMQEADWAAMARLLLVEEAELKLEAGLPVSAESQAA